MSLVDKKYSELSASLRQLSDITVLSQAWKKAHHYIRRHNWYANVLELDASAFNLEEQLTQWSAQLASQEYLPDELRVVPAPKNGPWYFAPKPQIFADLSSILDVSLDDVGPEPSFNDWIPKDSDEDKKPLAKLRPLAHVSVRDQAVSTAVLLCLANAVETAQGEPVEEFDEFSKPGASVSYGNRLHCTWHRSGGGARADFPWGNTRTYSEYFAHYRQFLARPIKVCREWAARIGAGNELYIIKLDLKSFFDCIDVTALQGVLADLHADYLSAHGDGRVDTMDYAGFWSAVARILSWHWADADKSEAALINADTEELPKGLPQGLVASGFLANAYLVGFDREMQRLVQEDLVAKGKDGIRLLDYCRYVDDLRVVIAVPANVAVLGQELLKASVAKTVQEVLVTHLSSIRADQHLTLNKDKTELQSYRSTSNQGSLSALMQAMKAGLSGTFDLDGLLQATGGLDGLLWLSEQMPDEQRDGFNSRLRLASIARPTGDVRDDTVKRFVATRLATVLRERLAMADADDPRAEAVELADKANSARVLAHEFENSARKLIKLWSQNPSLVLLLRCGLGLFPHPRLLEPVLEAIQIKLDTSDTEPSVLRQVRVAQYVASDLLRAGAVETGMLDEDQYPSGVQIDKYRQLLSQFARKVLKSKTAPWYLRQQALFYLAFLGRKAPASSFKGNPVELLQHKYLHDALDFSDVKGDELLQVLPLALVAQQIRPASGAFGAWLNEQLQGLGQADQERVIRLLAINAPYLLLAAAELSSMERKSWHRLLPSLLKEELKLARLSQRKRRLPSNTSLFVALRHENNPFASENATLVLGHALVSFMLANSSNKEEQQKWQESLSNGLAPHHIELHASDWTKLASFPDEQSFYIESIAQVGEPNDADINQSPSWIEEEQKWLYGFGRLLRCALSGEFDFTARRQQLVEDDTYYRGLRSTWYQRRTGLANSGSALLPESAPLSPWMSGFVSALLCWPGAKLLSESASEVDGIRSLSDMKHVLEKRIAHQKSVFAHMSATPVYVIPAAADTTCLRPLRIAVVQTLRPRRDEIDEKDPLHWTPSVLAQHRRHLATVCKLTDAKVKAWATGKKKDVLDEADHAVDIVLFPELAVHPEHLAFLRRLSDSLKAHIFTGLTYEPSLIAGGAVNNGLWLIRSETKGDGRRFDYVRQGKKYPMKDERSMGIKSHRPHVVLLEIPVGPDRPTRVAAVICYDATDIALAADLKNVADMFLVSAMNQDIATFDNMVASLNFHMYQPVILANSGEFGGSTAQAPYRGHEKLIAHVHGKNQLAVSIFEIAPWDFRTGEPALEQSAIKTPPAGFGGR